MKNNQEHLYFIAIVPPEPIRSEVTHIKRHFADQYKSKAALNSPAHITLQMPFKLDQSKVTQVKNLLCEFASHRNAFPLQIKNYNCFAPRVIYLDVLPSSQLGELQKELSRTLQLHFQIMNATHKGKGFSPHMTVAFRDLRPAQFKIAWEYFCHKEAFYEFIVDRITLLKHNGKCWDIEEEFAVSDEQ